MWGPDEFGELGDGAPASAVASPTSIAGEWRELSANYYDTAGIKADGTLWKWGANDSGQIGDGTTDQRFSPVQIGTDDGWAHVAAGRYHSLAVKTDGSLWAWGYNADGELGDGTRVSSKVPVRVGTGNDWRSVTANFYGSFAIKTDGSLWAWGANASGELGIPGGLGSLVPVQISSDSWAMVSSSVFLAGAAPTDLNLAAETTRCRSCAASRPQANASLFISTAAPLSSIAF